MEIKVIVFLEVDRCPPMEKLPFIGIKIAGRKTKALVDSGAQFSLMSLAATRSIGVEEEIDRTMCSSRRIRGIGTQRLIGGIESLDLMIGTSKFKQGFGIIQDIPCEIILGNDFLIEYKCTLSYKERCLFVGDKDVKAKFIE